MLKMLKEQRAQGEWNTVYMLIVFAIAALLMIALIKPMFRQSQTIVKPIATQPAVTQKP